MKTFKDYVADAALNENNTQQINKAAKEIHNFLFSGGGKAIDMENFIDTVLKDHKLSRSERKMVIMRVKNFHGYAGNALDGVLTESKDSLTFDRVTPTNSKGKKAIVYKYDDDDERESYPVEFYPNQIDEKKLLAAVRKILG